MKPEALLADIEKVALKPAYLVHGQEIVRREQLVDRIAAAVPEAFRDFNLQRFQADETSPSQILDHARTWPFMAPPRIVMVRGVDRYSAEDLTLFQHYLGDPNDRCALILIADKPDFRLKFFKTIKDKGWNVSFEAPKGRDLIDWVREAAERRDQTISEEAAQLLIEMVGTEPNDLDRELEKVSLFALERKRILPEDVRTAARTGFTANVFELGDAIGQGKPEKALSALHDLLFTEHYRVVLTMVIRHFRLLLKTSLLMEERVREGELAKELGLPPFVARNYWNQAQNLSLDTIKEGLTCLEKASLTLVTTSAPDKLVMEKLILDLATLRKPRRSAP